MSGGWLVTGAGGMLGRDVLARLAADGHRARGLDRRALDIADRAAVHAALRETRPAVVVNCAAWTAVDEAEARPEEAARANAEGPRRLAEACREEGAVLLQVSTDYVFAGEADSPYAEDAPTAPRSVYGRTKLAGELAVREILPEAGFVVRTAWLYGAGGPNFARTMIRLERERPTLEVVDDQRGQPTWSADLAALLARLGEAAAAKDVPAGIYHGTSGGETTWCGFAREIFRLLGADPERVRPTTSAAYVRPAPRPAYSVLGHGRWGAGEAIRPWRQALAAAFPALLRAEGRSRTDMAGADMAGSTGAAGTAVGHEDVRRG
ncbi:dTDP-4-dehydrorhamnose reductase [Streptomyces sp. DSM 44917]|uniref:dTDP-4-dehydrorhamnose reductase n=1 Tax=Streptomyces boetiae TaxID=3075541 RepID=A0ABU2L4G9_9ACTN|nr:dTDP-4-dehydrorhamnose reductase [Streptomyces sp. DSM 44917]MDT0306456.1 dTDP-4-dehydrorhamnose reductase [Streptomyces sp. DSM 44917]